ncbi:Leucine-rich repeat-containing protein 74A [Eumeta japonica]|uniref:Leucine-rich repeat-containing protein 74A n=1 Tax=Eumeta variegata TaxID=151549 RepID=A0A4C1ULJ3_EUMVA|nr:Leucine-rich repeat-containing protein 74A [Eumeta japonica]
MVMGWFANDTCLLFKINRQQPAFDEVNSTISEIVEWFSINYLLLNEKKTKLVQFSLTKLVDSDVIVKNDILYIVDTSLFLGFTLDAKLRWNSHIIRLAKRISSAAYAAKRIRRLTNKSTARLGEQLDGCWKAIRIIGSIELYLRNASSHRDESKIHDFVTRIDRYTSSAGYFIEIRSAISKGPARCALGGTQRVIRFYLNHKPVDDSARVQVSPRQLASRRQPNERLPIAARAFVVIITRKDDIDVVFEQEIETSSEEPPMEEWSSLILPPTPTDREKANKITSDDFPLEGSGDICAEYMPISDSAILRHPYYNYPAVTDPGIKEALLEPDQKKIYSDDGRDLYFDLCNGMHTFPIQRFHKELLEERVNLRYYGLNPVGVRPIAMALTRNKHVRVVDLTDNFLSVDACYHLGRMLEENFTLKELNLTGCRIGAEGARLLFSGLPVNRSLKRLNVSRNELGDDGAGYLAKAIVDGAGFRHLNLSYNNLNLKSALALTEAFESNNKLITLDLSWNSLYPLDGVVPFLMQLSQNEVLKELNLSWNSLAGEEIAESIKALLFAPALLVLDLSNNRLNDDVITPIIPVLSKIPTLETLNLSFNLISSTKAQKLLERFANPSVPLKRLYMDNIRVTQDFVTKRNEILQLPFRNDTIITCGDIEKPIDFQIDFREVLMNRLEYLGKKSKKSPLDVALYAQELLKNLNRPLISRELAKFAIKSGVKFDDDLCDAVAMRFPGPPGKYKMLDLEALVDYMKRKWPDRQLPATPPPELVKKEGNEEEGQENEKESKDKEREDTKKEKDDK